MSKQNLRFALGYVLGRRALSLICRSSDVRSGPKGPVIDLSIVGLESLSKPNLGFALGYVQSEPKGPVIDSSICGGAPGRLGNMLKHSTVWRPECLSNQNLRFALGYVLGRRALSWIFRPLASNPCSSVHCETKGLSLMFRSVETLLVP